MVWLCESMGVFETIDSVPWSQLHHAYGSASDVPDLLRALMCPGRAAAHLLEAAAKNSRNLREHVEWTLWGNVFHQGTIWQVTSHTVPFFVEILRAGPKNSELQAFVLTYLHHLAMGYPADDFPSSFDPETEFAPVVGIVAPGGEPDYEDADDNLYLVFVRDCYEAVEQHIEALLPFLDAEDERVAGAAIALCASFPRCTGRTIGPLRRIAESGGARSGHAAVSLAVLAGADALEVAESLVGASEPLTSILGACAAVLANSEEVSGATLAKLVAPLGSLAEERSVHTSTVRVLLGTCVARLPLHHQAAAVDALCEQHKGASVTDGLMLSSRLLSLVFGNLPVPSNAAELLPLQRLAVETIRQHGAFTWGTGTFGNYTNMLRDWGLPDSPEAIEWWLRCD